MSSAACAMDGSHSESKGTSSSRLATASNLVCASSRSPSSAATRDRATCAQTSVNWVRSNCTNRSSSSCHANVPRCKGESLRWRLLVSAPEVNSFPHAGLHPRSGIEPGPRDGEPSHHGSTVRKLVGGKGNQSAFQQVQLGGVFLVNL